MSSPSELIVQQTEIPGLLVLRLPVHRDARGWFKENWQRRRMVAAGLPDFGPVQLNVAHNDARGVTRGIHAEPWDKYISVSSGRIFGAWVDLRGGPGHGRLVTREIGPDMAVFVPRGVGNSYQTLDAGTDYLYLVNAHWSPAATERYTMVRLDDPTLAIRWPVPLSQAVLSDADRSHPALVSVPAMPPPRTVVLGAGGQLGQALQRVFPQALALDRARLDLADPRAVDSLELDDVTVVINAAAYTAVDAAQTPAGRVQAWATNATGVSQLVRAAAGPGCTVVHVSTDYVFDGEQTEHVEDEPVSPLGVYGQSKAAGEAALAGYPRHYLIRTSWLVGAGRNFVSTMAALADRGARPTVVDDQFGRLTFADDLAAGIRHLLDGAAPFGTYHLSNSGPVQSWADIAAEVFALRGRRREDVVGVSARQYQADHPGMAPRPRHSVLSLAKLAATGFTPPPAADQLHAYLARSPRDP